MTAITAIDFNTLQSPLVGRNEGVSFGLDPGFLGECQRKLSNWQRTTRQLHEMDQRIEEIELRARCPKACRRTRLQGLAYLVLGVAAAALSALAGFWLHGQWQTTMALGIATGSPVALVLLAGILGLGMAVLVVGGGGTVASLVRGSIGLICPARSIRFQSPSRCDRDELERRQRQYALSSEECERRVQTVRQHLTSLETFDAQDEEAKETMRRELQALEAGLQEMRSV